MVTTIAVIPARYASTRFPGKPLAKDTGKYLIQHVYERAAEAKRVDRVIVATDDVRIESAVKSFGGATCMTRADHPSGTDRVGEVVAGLSLQSDDIVVNMQGDEPDLGAALLDQLVEALERSDAGCRIATLAAPFDDDGPKDGPGSPIDPNCVKVVVDAGGKALYFSRSLVPFPRDTGGVVDRPSRWLLHLGVYAFRADTLSRITRSGAAGPSVLERSESLEQLRWLEGGLGIVVAQVAHRHVGIDTPEDYAAFVRRTMRTISPA